MALNTFGGSPSDVLTNSAGDVIARYTGGANAGQPIRLTVWTSQDRSTQVTTLYAMDGVTALPGYVTPVTSLASPNYGRVMFRASNAHSALWLWDGNPASDPWLVWARETPGNIGQALAKATEAAGSASAAQASADDAQERAAAAAIAAADAVSKVNLGGIVVNIENYAPAKDGVTDDTTPMQDALADAAAEGGGVVQLTPGRFLTTGITIPSGVTLRGAGQGATTIVQSGTPSWLIQATGSVAASTTTLTASAAVGATTLTVASTVGLSAGDLVILRDTFAYNSLDASYKSGEMLRVKSVDSGTAVTLYGPVRGSWATSDGSYTAANGATVSKVTPTVGVRVEGLSIEGDRASTTGLVLFQYVHRASIADVGITQGGHQGVRIDSCLEVNVTGYSCSDLVDDVPNGHAGYAVAVSGASEDVAVTGATIARCRHALTTLAGTFGMPHDIAWTGGTVSETSHTGIDTHAAGENIHIAGTVITGCLNGVSIRSRRTSVASCLIDQPNQIGINVAEEEARNVTLAGNVISRNTGDGHGIQVNTPIVGLTITDNVLDQIAADGIRVDSGSTRVRIGRNVITNVGMSVAGRTGVLSAATNGGTAATGDWDVFGNIVGQYGVGSAAAAVNLTPGLLTGARVYDNRAYGSFSSTVFNAASALMSRNVKVDTAPPAVTGAKGGNAALASLLTQLAAQGVITDSTT